MWQMLDRSGPNTTPGGEVMCEIICPCSPAGLAPERTPAAAAMPPRRRVPAAARTPTGSGGCRPRPRPGSTAAECRGAAHRWPLAPDEGQDDILLQHVTSVPGYHSVMRWQLLSYPPTEHHRCAHDAVATHVCETQLLLPSLCPTASEHDFVCSGVQITATRATG